MPLSCRKHAAEESILLNKFGSGLPCETQVVILREMWDEPYLESCCRSALHRLILAGESGRPPEPKDLPCLERLDGMGLALRRIDGRYRTTVAGRSRHEVEIQPPGRVA